LNSSHYENNLNYSQRRSLNLLNQVLNQNINFLQEKNNLLDLFKIYSLVLKNHASLTFISSLHKSTAIIKDFNNFNSEVFSLQNNNASSFLILPLMAYGHMFSCVFRKINGSYSATIVNKGDRFVDEQYIEYIFNDTQIKNLQFQLSLDNGKSWITDIYKIFEQESSRKFSYDVYNREQKIGNCYIKEPENAIKFAFATKSFKPKDFNLARKGNIFKVKWHKPTLSVHEDFVKALNASIKNLAPYSGEIFEIYKLNKLLKKFYKENNSLTVALNKLTYLKLLPKNKLGAFLNLLDIETIVALEQPLCKFLQMRNEFHIIGQIKMLKFIYNNYSSKSFMNNFELSKLNPLKKNFQYSLKQLQYRMHEAFLSKAIYEKGFGRFKADYLKKSYQLYPFNYHYYAFLGAIELEKYFSNNLPSSQKNALKNFDIAINLNPSYANIYYLRSILHKKVGNVHDSQKDLLKAISLDKNGVLRWQKLKPVKVFDNYFRELKNKKNDISPNIKKISDFLPQT
jgi:hypothetical protein